MANAHNFPLLRLPCIAWEHVIKIMDVREQYLFSTLSKKSKRVAKNGTRRLSYNFELHLMDEEMIIGVQKAGINFWHGITILPIHRKAFVRKDGVEDTRKSLIKQVAFLNDLFKISSFSLKCNDIPNDLTMQLLAAVKDMKIGIDKLEIRVNEFDSGMFEWVMSNCRDAKRLINGCYTTDDFQWNCQEPLAFEYLSLMSAPWLTLDLLSRFFMNCRAFEVATRQHQLTGDDINQFVKIWMNGSKLEFFAVILKEPYRLDFILSDIEKEPVQEAYIENDPKVFSAGKAFKIRQKCGKEAVVCILSHYMFKITTHFDSFRCDFWHRR